MKIIVPPEHDLYKWVRLVFKLRLQDFSPRLIAPSPSSLPRPLSPSLFHLFAPSPPPLQKPLTDHKQPASVSHPILPGGKLAGKEKPMQ